MNPAEQVIEAQEFSRGGLKMPSVLKSRRSVGTKKIRSLVSWQA
jgi:hypothetical protein